MMGGEVEAGMRALDEAARVGEKAGNVLGAAAALGNLGGMCMVRGQLRQAAAAYRRVLQMATTEQGRLLPVAGKSLLGLGDLTREWNDLDAAERLMRGGCYV